MGEGTWVWSDGSSYSYNPGWVSNHPTTNTNQNCVVMRDSGNNIGKWQHVGCGKSVNDNNDLNDNDIKDNKINNTDINHNTTSENDIKTTTSMTTTSMTTTSMTTTSMTSMTTTSMTMTS